LGSTRLQANMWRHLRRGLLMAQVAIKRVSLYDTSADMMRILREVTILRKLQSSHIVEIVDAFEPVAPEHGKIMSPPAPPSNNPCQLHRLQVRGRELDDIYLRPLDASHRGDNPRAPVAAPLHRRVPPRVQGHPQATPPPPVQAQLLTHRDLKPQNLLVRRDPAGGLKLTVCDFGLARILPNGVNYRRERTEADASGVEEGEVPADVANGPLARTMTFAVARKGC
jgi:serine/threonine protein kinase